MHKMFLGALVLAVSLVLPGSVFAEDMKLGYINTRKVIYEYKKMKDFQKEFEKKDKEAKDEFDKITNQIRKLRDEMDLLAEKAKKKKQAELAEKGEELNEFRRTKGEELMRWRDTKIREINDDVVSATEGFAKENGYDIVFDQMASVYSAKKYDITDEIIKILNK